MFAAVCADPADDAVRLVYADWLEENGQPERAEFIRTQCAHARLGRDDPREEALRRRDFALRAEQLHRGLATESLIDVLLNTEAESGDVMQLAFSDSDRRVLASILMKEDEELSPERLEGAVRALRRIALKRKLEQVQRELQGIRGREPGQIEALLQEKVRIKRALMDAGVAEQSPA